jgi:hypothetical protein
MSDKYGSHTRSGEAVSGLGRRGAGGGGAEWGLTEQEFTAPGTWTCPPTVTQVEVIVVGGGGGGGASADSTPGGGGGGGGVRTAVVPVSGPVHITVGSGGTGATYSPGVSATSGGTSAFGPLGPGPVPAIPASTVAVGGGGGGSSMIPTESSYPPIPTIGGGGGGLGYNYYPAFMKGAEGGRYGYPSASPSINSPSFVAPVGAGGAGGQNHGNIGGVGKLGFGYGAPSSTAMFRPIAMGGIPAASYPTGSATPTGWELSAALAGAANTGNGGGGGRTHSAPVPIGSPVAPTLWPGAPGGSGIVIVRYWSAP